MRGRPGRWEQLAEFFHTKKDEIRFGRTFDEDLYGAKEYAGRWLHITIVLSPMMSTAGIFVTACGRSAWCRIKGFSFARIRN